MPMCLPSSKFSYRLDFPFNCYHKEGGQREGEGGSESSHLSFTCYKAQILSWRPYLHNLPRISPPPGFTSHLSSGLLEVSRPLSQVSSLIHVFLLGFLVTLNPVIPKSLLMDVILSCKFIFFFFLFLEYLYKSYFMFMWDLPACIYVRVPRVCLPLPEARKGQQILWSCSYREKGATVWVLRIKSRSSLRVVNALNHWVTSPVPVFRITIPE